MQALVHLWHRRLSLLLGLSLLAVSGTGHGGVISASSSSYGLSVNLIVDPLLAPPGPFTAGPTPTSSGTAPGPYDVAGLDIFFAVSGGIIDVAFNSAVAVVSGSAGSSGGAFAATAVNSLLIVSLGGLFNLSADSVESAAAILGDSGALVVELADTRFTGAGAVISSGVLSAPLDTNPTPNTVVDVLGLLGLTGVSLILNEQILTGDGISNAGMAVNAIHLEFNDFASGLGILNGDIIIGHSEAQVQALPAQVPEPGTLALTALALAAMLRFRHRGSTSASVRPVA